MHGAGYLLNLKLVVPDCKVANIYAHYVIVN